jgi:hypothetical protein
LQLTERVWRDRPVQVQTAIYSTAAIEVTALGVGSLVVASLLDFTVRLIFPPSLYAGISCR